MVEGAGPDCARDDCAAPCDVWSARVRGLRVQVLGHIGVRVIQIARTGSASSDGGCARVRAQTLKRTNTHTCVHTHSHSCTRMLVRAHTHTRTHQDLHWKLIAGASAATVALVLTYPMDTGYTSCLVPCSLPFFSCVWPLKLICSMHPVDAFWPSPTVRRRMQLQVIKLQAAVSYVAECSAILLRAYVDGRLSVASRLNVVAGWSSSLFGSCGEDVVVWCVAVVLGKG